MAVQYLGCAFGTSITTTQASINLNNALDTTGGGAGHSGGFLPGDLVILASMGVSIPGAGLLATDSNDSGIAHWIELGNSTANGIATNNQACKLYYRFLNQPGDATTGPTLTITVATQANRGTSGIAFVFRGVKTNSAAFGNALSYIGSVAIQSSADPQPAALPGNTTAANNLILAVYYDDVINASVTPPANYALTASVSANGSSAKSQIGGAIRQLTVPAGTAEAPGPFAGYPFGNWAAITIPLDPAPLNLTDSVSETAATSTTQDATAFTGINEGAAAADAVTGVKSNADGRAFGGIYAVDFVLSGWSGRTLRQCFTPAILAAVPPGPMGARLEFAAGTSTTIGPAYIGHAAGAGDAYDFDGAQVQLTFDGGSPTKAVAGAVSIDTDKVAFPGYDPTKNLIVSCYLGAGTVNPKGYGF